jgi:coatomer subunit beta'
MAEDCLLQATDFSGLLFLYSSLGDAEGVTKLASMAKEQGKNNVAFLCLFMLGKLEECLQLLVDRYTSAIHVDMFNGLQFFITC